MPAADLSPQAFFMGIDGAEWDHLQVNCEG
jgi:hypothetical protein